MRSTSKVEVIQLKLQSPALQSPSFNATSKSCNANMANHFPPRSTKSPVWGSGAPSNFFNKLFAISSLVAPAVNAPQSMRASTPIGWSGRSFQLMVAWWSLAGLIPIVVIVDIYDGLNPLLLITQRPCDIFYNGLLMKILRVAHYI